MFIYTFEKREPWQMPLGYEGLEQAIDLMEVTVENGAAGIKLLNFLIDNAPTEQEKRLLIGMRNDELKHEKMLREIYRDITGEDMQIFDPVEINLPESYVDGIVEAILDHFETILLINTIQYGLQSERYRNILFEIRIDELRHADELNFIYTFNK